MSNVSVSNKLEVGVTISEGIGICLKNFGPILVNGVLYMLTCWIPYINIGTTIGLSVGLIAKASRGEAISYTEIFDPQYRKPMGEFFLTAGLVGLGVGVGAALFIIPGCVLGLAWFFATLLVVDKKKSPMEALSLSNTLTYGNKGRIFLILFIVGLVISVVSGIIGGIGGAIGGVIAGITSFLVLVISILSIVVVIGIEASMYKQLASNV